MTTANQNSTERFVAWGGLAIAIVLSLGGFLLSTQHGMGLGNDSPAFIRPALAHLRGETIISLHHPPLFGWLIWAVARASGQDVVDAVRGIQLVATLSIIAGIWWQLRWALPTQPYAAGAAAVLSALCFPLVEHAGNVGSDQLGAAFTVWTLAFLARHLAHGDGRWLAACLLTAAMAFLNRFAGFGLVLSVSTVLWLHRGQPFGRDFFKAFGAGLVMVTPCLVHLISNKAATGQATSREVVWNGIPWDRIRQGLESFSSWYFPTSVATWGAGLGIIATLAVAFWLSESWGRAPHAARVLMLALVGFCGSNFAFLITTISLVEYGLALDSRTLLPYSPVSLALGILTVGLLPTATPLRRAIPWLIFSFLFAMSAHRAASLVASYSVLGKHHSGVSAAQSVLPNFVHAHPAATFITNNPPRFFNLTRTECLALPAEYSILTNLRAPDFDADVSKYGIRLRADPNSYLVVFDTSDLTTRASPQELLNDAPAVRVMHDYFVSIYRLAPLSIAPNR